MPPSKTPLSGEQAAQALRSAWTRIHGAPPSNQTLSMLLAQWAHETGAGRAMYNFNFGGIKGASPSGLTMTCRTREGHGASERTIRDAFRAYTSAEEGAEDYLRLLQRRYGAALEGARAGAPQQFVHALKTSGYFTGSETAYAASITRLSSAILSDGPDAVGRAERGATSLDYRPVRSSHAPTSSPETSFETAHVDPATAVSILTLGLPDSIARSIRRILTDEPRNSEPRSIDAKLQV